MDTASPPRSLVLWNSRAGRAADAVEAHALFHSFRNVVVHETQSNAEAGELARTAAEQGFQRVVSAGGDGTLNAAVNGLIEGGGKVSLAVMPIGTANDFALTLAMPDELTEAAEVCLFGATRRIDAVECQSPSESRYFANVAAGGNSDHVTRCLTSEIKERWGAFCYLRGAIDVLADLEIYHAQVRFDDDEEFEMDLWNVIIANGRTNAGHLPVAPRANPEDGLIDVILIRDGTAADLAGIMARFLTSDYLDSPQVLFRQVRRVGIRSTPPMGYSLDGEAIDKEPIAFRCLPGAVEMVIGPAYIADPTEDDAAPEIAFY